MGQAPDHGRESRRRDAGGGRIELADGLADRAHRARTPDRLLPAERLERRLDGLEFDLAVDQCAVEALLRDASAGKMLERESDAAHVQALEHLGLIALADDALGAAAADVD